MALKNLPPTDKNALLHVLRAQHQMMFWKAAYKKEPSLQSKDIASFAWTVEDVKVTPKIAKGPIAPEGMTDIIS